MTKIYIGVLVVYYEPYYEVSILEFKKMLNLLGDNKIYIVSNNPDLIFDLDESFEILNGNDLSSEFSAYDVAYEKIKYLDDVEGVIFANDTFCIHRPWRFLYKELFNNVFLKNKLGNYFCGEVDRHKKFIFEGCEMSGWISSYLFTLPCENFRKDMRFDNGDYLYNKYVSEITDTGIIWKDKGLSDLGDLIESSFSKNTLCKNRLSNYNIAQKRIKLKAILNELHLSSAQIKSGYNLLSITNNMTVKQIIKMKLYHIKRKICSLPVGRNL